MYMYIRICMQLDPLEASTQRDTKCAQIITTLELSCAELTVTLGQRARELEGHLRSGRDASQSVETREKSKDGSTALLQQLRQLPQQLARNAQDLTRIRDTCAVHAADVLQQLVELQHAAGVLQQELQRAREDVDEERQRHARVLQQHEVCVAVCFRVLRCVAGCCSVLQHVLQCALQDIHEKMAEAHPSVAAPRGSTHEFACVLQCASCVAVSVAVSVAVCVAVV